MDESVDAVDAAGMAARGTLGDLLGGAGDASNRGDDPDFVARADAAVSPSIALESSVWAGGGRSGLRLVEIVAGALQGGREIVAVDMFARRDGAPGPTDRKAELQHRLAGGNGRERYLVAALHRLREGNAERLVVGGEVTQCGGDVVARIDLEEGPYHDPLIDRKSV